MKRRILKIGICLLAFGLIGIIFCGANSRININQMTPGDWQSCQHVNGIGPVTIKKLEADTPIDRIQDVSKISGIGAARSGAIERHFCTYDTCRFEIYLSVLAFACVCAVIGALMITHSLVKRRCLKSEPGEFIKR